MKASTAPQYLRSGLKAADPKPATPAKPAKPEPTTFAITPLPYAYDALVKKGISKEQVPPTCTRSTDTHHRRSRPNPRRQTDRDNEQRTEGGTVTMLATHILWGNRGRVGVTRPHSARSPTDANSTRPGLLLFM